MAFADEVGLCFNYFVRPDSPANSPVHRVPDAFTNRYRFKLGKARIEMIGESPASAPWKSWLSILETLWSNDPPPRFAVRACSTTSEVLSTVPQRNLLPYQTGKLLRLTGYPAIVVEGEPLDALEY